MECTHDFVIFNGCLHYLQDGRDCTHWFRQCTKCSALEYEYHGDLEREVAIYHNGKLIHKYKKKLDD